MRVIKHELTVAFDVDETLVMSDMTTHPDVREFICPYTKEILFLVPHKDHIKLLKDQKARGYHVTVWSANGWEWAKTVLETLNLTSYVDECRSKFVKFVDDLPANEVLVSRVYIDFK